MLSVGRTAIFLLAVLTLVYFGVYFYLREGVKMRLEREWEEAGRPGERADWVADRLAPRADRISRWLIVVVYGLPMVILSAVVYFSN